MKQVKLGFIGTGPRSQSLLRQAVNINGLKIKAICDKIEPLVKQAYDTLKDTDIKCYTDHKKMLKDADIDAVFVVVEPENMADLVCHSLEAGKHVLSEVPMTFTIEDIWRIVLSVEKTGLKYQLAEPCRFMPFAQAWKKMAAEGQLGKIVYAEGEYLHGMTNNRYWLDSKTGKRLTLEEAKNNPRAKKSRLWNMSHPILYLPHELSPILNILDDRVVNVACMGTRKQSYVHEWYPVSDIEVALMHTEKDTVLKMAAGFTIQTIWRDVAGYHWYRLIGTKGTVELNRSNADKCKMFLADSYMTDRKPAEMDWEYNPHKTPPEVFGSGHGGSDYFSMATFAEAIINNTPPHMDVYQAAESAAPAIIAAQSAEKGCMCLDVPDFRPNKKRRAGQEPKEGMAS